MEEYLHVWRKEYGIDEHYKVSTASMRFIGGNFIATKEDVRWKNSVVGKFNTTPEAGLQFAWEPDETLNAVFSIVFNSASKPWSLHNFKSGWQKFDADRRAKRA